jgi:hypothetical protein
MRRGLRSRSLHGGDEPGTRAGSVAPPSHHHSFDARGTRQGIDPLEGRPNHHCESADVVATHRTTT